MSKGLSIKDAAKMFKALSDQNRLAITLELAGGEKNASSLLKGYNLSQPTMSHHLAILCESGIINARRSGKSVMYSLNRENAAELSAFLGIEPEQIAAKSSQKPQKIKAVKITPEIIEDKEESTAKELVQYVEPIEEIEEPSESKPSRVVDFFD